MSPRVRPPHQSSRQFRGIHHQRPLRYCGKHDRDVKNQTWETERNSVFGKNLTTAIERRHRHKQRNHRSRTSAARPPGRPYWALFFKTTPSAAFSPVRDGCTESRVSQEAGEPPTPQETRTTARAITGPRTEMNFSSAVVRSTSRLSDSYFKRN